MPLSKELFDFDSLTKAQQDTLGRIAIREDTNLYHPKTIKVLLERGMIVETFKAVAPVLNGRFPVHLKMYVVPLPVHIRWCEWCSKNYAQDQPNQGDV